MNSLAGAGAKSLVRLWWTSGQTKTIGSGSINDTPHQEQTADQTKEGNTAENKSNEEEVQRRVINMSSKEPSSSPYPIQGPIPAAPWQVVSLSQRHEQPFTVMVSLESQIKVMFVRFGLLQGDRVLRENLCRYMDNMQTPHRLPQTGFEPRIIAVRQWLLTSTPKTTNHLTSEYFTKACTMQDFVGKK